MDNRPVGIFDSGVGGLTVVQEMRQKLPNEQIIYFGDTAHVPYGSKSPETVLQYGREILRFLNSQSIKAAIIACGTISSNCYTQLVQEFDIPIVDVIMPGVEACINANPREVGFIATESTVRSGAFKRLLAEKDPKIPLRSKACPLFVPLVEEGWTDNAVTQLVAEIYLQEWQNQVIDTLVLGCTHYPLLSTVLRRLLPEVNLINMAESTVLTAARLLQEKELLNDGTQPPVHTFYVSGGAEKFNATARLMLGEDISAERVALH